MCDKEFTFGPWFVKSTKGTILSTQETDQMCSDLDIPQIPEMVFGRNTFQIQYKDGFNIGFNACDALKLVDNKHDKLKVAVAKEWKESRLGNADIEKVTKPFDWTFTTDYKGTITNQEHLDIEESEEKIDFEKLKKREKILYFDEMVLFEDELADNGSAELNLKVRVMESCMYVLMRFFLRVDGVLCRIHDTRLYHDYQTDFLIREYKEKEAMWKDLSYIAPGKLTDPCAVEPCLKTKLCLNEKLKFTELAEKYKAENCKE